MRIESIEITKIKVSPERFRPANQEDVEKRAISMLKFGQLQPIIVDAELNLVDGLHRREGAALNGWTHIDCVFREELDALFLREMELEANIQRKQMTWQEEQKAIAEIHKIKVDQNPNWGQVQTQELVGAARQGDVSEAITLTQMMKLFPEIAGAKSKSQALSWAKAKARSVERVLEVRDHKADYEFLEKKIWLGDSVKLIKEIPDESFHAVITDPPFGVDDDARAVGGIGSLTSYQDDEESYARLLSMAPDIYRVLKPNGWFIWFFGMSWYQTVKETFREAGFVVDELPIVWDRSEGRTFTNRPDRYFTRGYDVALHCFKGEPGMAIKGRPNVLRIPPVSNSERETFVERPTELYAELIKRLTIPGEIVADFFVGGGGCPAAAAQLGRDFFGIERDAERRAYALKKIRANLPDAAKAS